MARTRDLLHRNEPVVARPPVYRGDRVRVMPVRKPPRRLDPPEPVGVPIDPRRPLSGGASAITSQTQPPTSQGTQGHRPDAGGEG
jgi:hypothetical protein